MEVRIGELFVGNSFLEKRENGTRKERDNERKITKERKESKPKSERRLKIDDDDDDVSSEAGKESSSSFPPLKHNGRALPGRRATAADRRR